MSWRDTPRSDRRRRRQGVIYLHNFSNENVVRELRTILTKGFKDIGAKTLRSAKKGEPWYAYSGKAESRSDRGEYAPDAQFMFDMNDDEMDRFLELVRPPLERAGLETQIEIYHD